MVNEVLPFHSHVFSQPGDTAGPHTTDGKPRLREVRWIVQNHSGRREESKDIILHVDFSPPWLASPLGKSWGRWVLLLFGNIPPSEMLVHLELRVCHTPASQVLVKFSFALCAASPLG